MWKGEFNDRAPTGAFKNSFGKYNFLNLNLMFLENYLSFFLLLLFIFHFIFLINDRILFFDFF